MCEKLMMIYVLFLLLCINQAMDTDEKQQPEQDASEAAVAALLDSRKLSLQMKKVVLKTEQDNVFRLVEQSPPNEDQDEDTDD
jgi:hypothetical protein